MDSGGRQAPSLHTLGLRNLLPSLCSFFLLFYCFDTHRTVMHTGAWWCRQLDPGSLLLLKSIGTVSENDVRGGRGEPVNLLEFPREVQSHS